MLMLKLDGSWFGDLEKQGQWCLGADSPALPAGRQVYAASRR